MVLAVILLALASALLTSSAHPILLFSTPKDIRFTNLLRQSKANIIVKDLEGAGGLDFFYEKHLVCWTDQKLEVIQCINFNGTHSGNKVTIVTTGLATPDGLACDWLTDKIYWTESESKRIEVVSLNGKFKKVLFWDDIDQPRAIALVPTASIMFWSDWGEVPKIERGAMNGDPSSRKVLVSDGIFWPNGITIDYDSNKVYWLDARLHFIESMDYDGKNRRKVVSEKGIRYPYALTLFKEKLYWTDWETWCVYTIDRSQPSHPKEFIDNPDQVPMDVRVMDSSRQPFKWTPCHENNGGCSHLCLLSPNPPGYTCACPTGVKLIDNYTCANGPQELLLLVQLTEICMISLDSPDYTSVVLPLKGVKHGVAIDFDPLTKYLYWTDDEMAMIKRARLNGSGYEVLISSELQHPDGVAIDWRAQNMYWTDTGTDRIQVMRIGTPYTKVLINANLGEPRAIAVSPDEGLMFWSDWNEKWPKLERAALDGSQRSILVDTHLGWPNGIALDIPRRKVYWCDAKTDLIEVINYDGTDRREVITDNIPHVFGLTLVGDYLYWTDWQRRILDSAHKVTGEDRKVILDQQANMMGLKGVGPYKEPKTMNPCSTNNGNCAHLCLNTPTKYVCACQMGYELSTNGYTCVVPEAFILFTRKDNIGRISIENAHNDAIIPVSGIKEAGALDFDIRDSRIYWTDIKSKFISRAFINGSSIEKIVEFGLEAPEGLAVDWIAHNIYWIDTGTKRIEVALLDGSFRRAIIWSGLQEPKSIAVDPIQGFIYWSDWAGSGTLHRAHLDGSNPKLLLAKVGQANSLTVDLPDKVIYWCAVQEGAVEAANLDGTRRRVVARSPSPSAMSLYQDKIYWFDSKSKDLYVTRKVPGSDKSILHSNNDQITSLVVYHSWSQSGWGICANRGSCPQLCLNKCVCQSHYTLEKDKCKPPSSFMLLSSKNLVSRLYFNSSDVPDAPIPVHGLKNVKALEYDPLHQILYWIDGRAQTIRKWSFVHGGASTALQVGDYHPNSLALDPYSRVLFWSCASDGTINATKLDNVSTPVVIFRSLHMEKPRFIRVHPLKGLLYWVAEGRETRIYTGRLDGKRRKTLISGLPSIYSFTVDYRKDALYWLTFNAVETSDIEGHNRHELVSGLNQKFGSIAVMGRFLYILNARGVSSVDIDTKKVKDVYFSNQHLTDLIAVNTPVSKVDTSWYCQNGEKTNSYLECSPHLSMCTSEQFACVSNEGDCIPLKWKCDALTDCFDGSDEANCPECGANQFTCSSGHCIDIRFKCDGTAQCSDNSDESDCCVPSGGYQCDGKCIHKALMCDGWKHCSDGSDESIAACVAHDTTYSFHSSSHTHLIIIGFILTICLVIAAYAVYRCRMRKVKRGCGGVLVGDPVLDPLSPKALRGGGGGVGGGGGGGGPLKMASVRMSSLQRSSSSQPSTGSLLCYPLNPPPSPATTSKEMCSSLYRPPPPTPCSTDVCHETDSNYQGESEPLPPPPTPTSLSPSPSSSTYFHPTPPPPSPTP